MSRRKYQKSDLGDSDFGVGNIVHSKVREVDGVEVSVEVDSFVRVYCSGYNVSRLLMLSGGSLKLLFYCMGVLSYGDNYVVVNVRLFMRKSGISSMTSYRSYVKELVDAKILGRTKVCNVFYIDHNLFFRGSRLNNLDSALIIRSK